MIVSWNTTNACNMFCAHCYRESGGNAFDGDLTTAEGRKMIDEIAAAGFKIMIFSGGEPLMRDDIEELIAHAASRGLRPVLGTNGSLLTPDKAAGLKKAGLMRAGISLDSLDTAAHDRLRGFPGAWGSAVAGMAACREAGLPFQIHTTVMKWNLAETEQLTDFAVEHGAAAHHIFFLIPVGRGLDIEDNMLSAEEYEDVLIRIIEKQKEVPMELKPTCAPQFMRIAKSRGVEMRFSKGCIAGISYCIVSPRGNVQPCAYFPESAGNVLETPFDEIWKNSGLFKTLRTCEYKGGCGTCSYNDICGGCRARAYYQNGDYMGEDSWCMLNRSGA